MPRNHQIYSRDSSPNRTSRDPHYFWFFLHGICWRAFQKNTVHEVLDFLKNFLASISPKIIQKTEKATVGRHRFWWNFDGKFYVRKQIFWAMGEKKFESYEKIKIKKEMFKNQKKRKDWILSVSNLLYSNSYHFLTLLLSSLLLLLSFRFSYWCPRQLSSGCSCDQQQHTISIQTILSLFTYSICDEKVKIRNRHV